MSTKNPTISGALKWPTKLLSPLKSLYIFLSVINQVRIEVNWLFFRALLLPFLRLRVSVHRDLTIA